jgi:hypothetical protein
VVQQYLLQLHAYQDPAIEVLLCEGVLGWLASVVCRTFVLLHGTCIGSFEVPLAELYAIMGGQVQGMVNDKSASIATGSTSIM